MNTVIKMNSKKLPLSKLKIGDQIVINQKVYTISSIVKTQSNKDNDSQYYYDVTSIDDNNNYHLHHRLDCNSTLDVPDMIYKKYTILSIDDHIIPLNNNNDMDIKQSTESQDDIIIVIKNNSVPSSVEIKLY